MVNADENSTDWDRRAAGYDRTPGWAERLLIGDSRAWLLRHAAGDTLEVAAGTGRNLGRYPAGVRLTALDLSAGMLGYARERAATLGLDVDFREADAGDLPFPDAAFDTVVCTLAVCAVPDRGRALDEMVRVLRPGGRLLLVDHLERRWRQGRPATLALRRGLVAQARRRKRLGAIELLVARKEAPVSAS
jgi:ubiquinone/menaquinone biosynthesis C-methylase UbiE